MTALFDNAVVISAIAVAVSIFGLLTTFFATYASSRMKTKYDEDRHMAVVSMMRNSYEDKIADLNARLLTTEDRWKDVNHLLLDNQRHQPPIRNTSKVFYNTFLQQIGIDESDIEIDPRLVFVLTPFNDRERSTFNSLQSVCSRIGFRCVRGDEDFIPGEILPHIVRLITQARFVVANISGRNPNVYYELGIAHALGKPTILVSRTLEGVPFDLKTKRIVLFSNKTELVERFREAMSQLLAEEGSGQPY